MSWWHLCCPCSGRVLTTAQQDVGNDASRSNSDSVRLTLELSWGMPANDVALLEGAAEGGAARADRDLVLELSEGRVLDAVPWPPEERRTDVNSMAAPDDLSRGPGPNGSWRLGNEPRGRVRVRIEAPWTRA